MNMRIFSYRYAEEIIQYERHGDAWNEIWEIINNTPVFIYPNKSVKNTKLDVMQQIMNTCFDYILVNNHSWEFHPLATRIENSQLKADYRKSFEGLTIQAEVQFGNMARWYSDIFKFQTAYSQSLIKIGLSIIPVYDLAVRIDSNVVNFERAIKEIASAEMSITLPILLIGLAVDQETSIIDVSKCQFSNASSANKRDNRCRIVHGYLNNIPMEQISPDSPLGHSPYPGGEDDGAE